MNAYFDRCGIDTKISVSIRRVFTRSILAIGYFSISVSLCAQSADPDPKRFQKEIEKFSEWDSKNAFPKDAVLFVGSSSIRMWKTALAFPKTPVINRGFGGSELSDVNFYYKQLVEQYAPKVIYLYEGDNDIANGKSAEQVLADYKELVRTVRSTLPQTTLAFISIKPSASRWEKWPIMSQANDLIKSFTKTDPKLRYVDLATPLFDRRGALRQDIFISDGLHLNDNGYRLWRAALLPSIESLR